MRPRQHSRDGSGRRWTDNIDSSFHSQSQNLSLPSFHSQSQSLPVSLPSFHLSSMSSSPMSRKQDWSAARSYLTPGTLDFKFSSCEDAEARIDKFFRRSPQSHYVVIREIPLKEFEKLDENYQTHSRVDYFRYIELLVLYLKMPTLIHNKAFTDFRDL